MKTKTKAAVSSLALAVGLFGFAAIGSAADLAAAPYVKAPVVDTWSPWQVRLRALGVIPDESATLYAGGAVLPGASVRVTNNLTPELDISYYFTRNIAAELILGVTRHDVNISGGAFNNVPVGSAWLLPPTLTLQYHFTNFGAFQPYIGGGVNYTVFFNQKPGDPTNGGGITTSNLHNAWGGAAQFGFDYMLSNHLGLNVDVKKIWLRPDWNGALAIVTPLTGKVTLDPWIIGTGLTYRF
jgi:outer membrane protein